MNYIKFLEHLCFLISDQKFDNRFYTKKLHEKFVIKRPCTKFLFITDPSPCPVSRVA